MLLKTNTQIQPYTIIGLVIALLGMPLVSLLFKLSHVPLTNMSLIVRESIIFLLGGVIYWIIVKKEKRKLQSIGLHFRNVGKSILWGFLLFVVLMVVLVVLIQGFQYAGLSFGKGANANAYKDIALWAFLVMVLRAGIMEEFYFRGFLMHRLKEHFPHTAIYVWLPSLLFGLFHYPQGVTGMVISFVAGVILAFAQLKHRSLLINMIAHFLVDFVPNILFPLLGASDK